MAVNQRELRRILRPLGQKLRLLISRAIITAIRDDEGIQLIQVKGLPDEVLDGIERFQNYGFTSVPLPGAEAIVVFVGGARSHGVAIAVDDRRHRKKDMTPGESALHTDEGDYVYLKRGRIIEVFSGGEIKVNAQTITIDGATQVDIKSAAAVVIEGGTVEIAGTTTIEGKVFLPHQHSGVDPGSSNTGGVV
jgi:phage baseplate assembly protein V